MHSMHDESGNVGHTFYWSYTKDISVFILFYRFMAKATDLAPDAMLQTNLTVCTYEQYRYRSVTSKSPSLCKCPPPSFDDPTPRVYLLYTYKWLLRVSAHPLFDDPMARVYLLYTYKWLLRVNAHPCFLACEFQAPMGTYSGNHSTCRYSQKPSLPPYTGLPSADNIHLPTRWSSADPYCK